MILRYSTKEMNEIWSEESKFNAFLKVELASTKAFYEIGIIPKEDYIKISKNAKFDLKRINEIEKKCKHDLIAFTRNISENLGEEKRWVHYKLTSSDVIDTAYAVLLKDANLLIKKKLETFKNILKEQAHKYKNTPIIGRTHGIHAEPTSFGLKWALWYDDMQKNIIRFNNACREIEVGKISGSVGNFANVPIIIQDKVCAELEINSSNISTQILQREMYANYIHTISLIASTLEKIAVEIRTLQRTEIGEVQEYFSDNQKGSSSMPHKKNPIASENITGISRILKGYVFSSYENIPLWNERDISHSSVERVIIPDATTLIDYALERYSDVLKNLLVNEAKMEKNIWLTNGLVFSQRVLSTLIEKGFSREKAFDLVQKLSNESYSNNLNFKNLLLKNEIIKNEISKNEINEIFNYKYFLNEVDEIFKRVFKEKKNEKI